MDFDNRILHVSHSKTPGGEARVVPLTGRLYDILASFRRERGIVFTYSPAKQPSEANAHEGSQNSAGDPIKIVKTAWTASLRRAGLRHFRFHDLRHTANTRLMLAGVFQEIRRELIGHSSQHSRDVNDRYTQIGLAELKDAIAKLEVWFRAQVHQLAQEEAKAVPQSVPSPNPQEHQHDESQKRSQSA